jgi:hypothetical protein
VVHSQATVLGPPLLSETAESPDLGPLALCLISVVEPSRSAATRATGRATCYHAWLPTAGIAIAPVAGTGVILLACESARCGSGWSGSARLDGGWPPPWLCSGSTPRRILLSRHRRCQRIPSAAQDVRPVERDRRRRGHPPRHLPPEHAGPRLPQNLLSRTPTPCPTGARRGKRRAIRAWRTPDLATARRLTAASGTKACGSKSSTTRARSGSGDKKRPQRSPSTPALPDHQVNLSWRISASPQSRPALQVARGLRRADEAQSGI